MESAAAIGPQWAREATNVLIDSTGRIANRNGWVKQHSSAVADTVKQVFEYRPRTGNNVIIFTADTKVYKDETSPTDISGSVTITADNWKFQNINGNMIGVQDNHEPIWWDGSGNFEYLVDQNDQWGASTVYALGDVVVPTSRDGNFYVCTNAGTSNDTEGEPTWDTTLGNTTTETDGVTWIAREIPKGNECLAAWGRVWIVDEDRTSIYYSDLLIPQNNSGSGGTLDLKTVWVHGMDKIEALTSFNNNLVIWGNDNIVSYTNADDVTSLALTDIVVGTGCVARDSIQHIDEDVFFLHGTGVRSLKRTVIQDKAPLSDVTKNVRNDIVGAINLETTANIRSIYHRSLGMYLVTFPTSAIVYCIDIRRFNSTGQVAITTWDSMEPTAFLERENGDFLMGHGDGFVGKITGSQDNGNAYISKFKTGWTNLSNYLQAQELANKEIIIKEYEAILIATASVTPTLTWTYDFTDIGGTFSKVITIGGISEYNIAEYNIAEWSGGATAQTITAEADGSGKVISLGLSMAVDNTEFSFQYINLLFKLGRIS